MRAARTRRAHDSWRASFRLSEKAPWDPTFARTARLPRGCPLRAGGSVGMDGFDAGPRGLASGGFLSPRRKRAKKCHHRCERAEQRVEMAVMSGVVREHERLLARRGWRTRSTVDLHRATWGRPGSIWRGERGTAFSWHIPDGRWQVMS